MPYTKSLIFLCNLGLFAASAGIYWFGINLWHDQAFFLSTTLGIITSGVTTLVLSLGLLSASKPKVLSDYLVAMLCAVFFAAQLSGFIYGLWIKSAGP